MRQPSARSCHSSRPGVCAGFWSTLVFLGESLWEDALVDSVNTVAKFSAFSNGQHHRSAERLRLVLLEAKSYTVETLGNLNDTIRMPVAYRGQVWVSAARNRKNRSAINNLAVWLLFGEMTKYTSRAISWTGVAPDEDILAQLQILLIRTRIILKGRAIGVLRNNSL